MKRNIFLLLVIMYACFFAMTINAATTQTDPYDYVTREGSRLPTDFGANWGVNMPSIGVVKPIVLILDFAEDAVDDPSWLPTKQSYLKPVMNQLAVDLNQVSYGKMNMQIDKMYYYRMTKTLDEYGGRAHRPTIISDTLTALCVQGELFYSDHDGDGDGFIDGVYVFATTSRLFGGSTASASSVKTENYLTREIDYTPYAIMRMSRVGVQDMKNELLHETAHMLGFPDLYPKYGFKTTDFNELLTGGNYINTYFKYLLGWIDNVEIVTKDKLNGENGEFVLSAWNDKKLDENETRAVIIAPDFDENHPFSEFFLMEYIRRGAETDGVLVWHFDAELYRDVNGSCIFKNVTNINLHARFHETIDADIEIAKNNKYKTGMEFTPYTVTTSNFNDDVFTGVQMEVLEMTPEYAAIRTGFTDIVPIKAKVSYSTTEITNQNVTATITFPEPVIITSGLEYLTETNDESVYTIEFTENAQHIIKYTDLEGNEGVWVDAKVNWIDKTPPDLSHPRVSVEFYCKEYREMFDAPKYATLWFSKPMTIISGNEYLDPWSSEYTYDIPYDENIPPRIKVVYEDMIGNIGELIFMIDKVNDVGVYYSKVNNITETTDIMFNNLTFYDPKKLHALVTLHEENELINVSTIYLDLVDDVPVMKKVSVPSGTSMDVFTIYTLDYDTESLTNKDVTATLKVSEGITILNNNGSNKYTFTKNGSFDFELQNEAGTILFVTAEVDWIDKEPPTASVQLIPDEFAETYGTFASIQFSEPVIITSGAEFITKRAGNQNVYDVSFIESPPPYIEIEFKDLAGNVGEPLTVEINWTRPNLVVNENYNVAWFPGYSINRVQFMVQNLSGEDKILNFIISEYDQNGDLVEVVSTHEIVARINPDKQNVVGFMTELPKRINELRFDLLEADTGTPVIVTQIRPRYITADVEFSESEPTNQTVTATITFSERVTILGDSEFLKPTDNELVYTIEFEENGEHSIYFTGLNGNFGFPVTVKVNWIDKTPPTAQLHYFPADLATEETGYAIIMFSEPVLIISGSEHLKEVMPNYGFIVPFTKTYPLIFEIEFVDFVGNVGTKTIVLNSFFKDISINENYEVLKFDGEDNNAGFRIKNNSNEAKTLHFIVAEYNETILVNSTLHETKINANATTDKQIPIPETENEVKLMLWDTNKMEPIIDSLQF